MPKRIELDPDVRGRSELILVRALLRNRFAVARMGKIAERFPEMVDMPLMKYPPFYQSPGTATRPPEYSIEEHVPVGIDKVRVEEYALELRQLADSYGLRCDWIIGRLHTQIRHMIDPNFRVLNVTTLVTHVIDDFNAHVHISPETRKEDVLREVKKEWQRIRANPEFRQRIKPPLNFNLAVEFLGYHIIYKYTSEQIIRVFPEDSKNYLASDIDREIKKAARLLDIKLTSKQPRKAKKI